LQNCSRKLEIFFDRKTSKEKSSNDENGWDGGKF
jgi:hypothetical protein